MTTDQAMKHAERQVREAEEALLDAVTDALCQTYKKVTGKPPTTQLRERLWDALRFHV